MKLPLPMTPSYLVDVIDGSFIDFQYFPEEIAREDAPQIASIAVVGRSHPVYQFVHGGELTLEMTLDFHWMENAEEVEQKISWLRSLTYPDTQSNGQYRTAPHPALLIIGQLFDDTEFLVQRVRVKYHTKFEIIRGLPLFASANVTLAEFKTVNVNYKTVRRFGG